MESPTKASTSALPSPRRNPFDTPRASIPCTKQRLAKNLQPPCRDTRSIRWRNASRRICRSARPSRWMWRASSRGGRASSHIVVLASVWAKVVCLRMNQRHPQSRHSLTLGIALGVRNGAPWFRVRVIGFCASASALDRLRAAADREGRLTTFHDSCDTTPFARVLQVQRELLQANQPTGP